MGTVVCSAALLLAVLLVDPQQRGGSVNELHADPGPRAFVPPPGFRAAAPTARAQAARSTTDLPDDQPDQPQIHFFYVLPSDGVDRALDTNGLIAGSVSALRSSFTAQTGGLILPPDTQNGALDITFFRLARSDAEIAAMGTSATTGIESELNVAGLLKPNKLYGAYYDGGNSATCASAAWPPRVRGKVGSLYLQGFSGACSAMGFAPAGGTPGYLEFLMLHELMHTAGLAPECAAHSTPNSRAHVSDTARDLMWNGSSQWLLPAVLDSGRDDYFQHGNPNCLDLDVRKNFSPPALAGSAIERQFLTAAPGSWSAAAPLVTTRRWERCDQGEAACVPITEGANDTYAVSKADVGSRIRVVETAANLTGATSATTSATRVVRAAAYGISVVVAGKGRVTSTPTGIACPARCGRAFATDSVVRLRAKPAAGFRFVRWSGSCGQRASCALRVVDTAQAVRATFRRR